MPGLEPFHVRQKKNDGEAPYSVSFTATQSGDVIVQLHPHSQLERAVRHERQAQATEPPASASPAAPPAPAAAPPAAEPAPKTYAAAAASQPQGATAGGQPAAPAGPAAAARVPPPPMSSRTRRSLMIFCSMRAVLGSELTTLRSRPMLPMLKSRQHRLGRNGH